MKKIHSYLLLLSLFCPLLVWAADTFEIRAIRLEGLQRITEGTALNYLPISVGDTLYPEDTANIIQALYKTDFFEDVSLDREGNTLVIYVVERPIITDLNISGNSDVSTDKLLEALKKVDIAEGAVYNPSTLGKLKIALQEQYYSRGKYNAKISTNVVTEARNRVTIDIKIDEGSVARIKGIDIIGNVSFTDDELIKKFTLQPPHWYTFITNFLNSNNQYSKEGLDASLKELQSFYMDRGYIEFKVESAQVTITPEKDKVFIIIKLFEGTQYNLGTYSVSGELLVPQEEVLAQINLKTGDIFNRQAVIDTQTALTTFYGNMGYAFASINIQSEVDAEQRVVNINFDVTPGERVYVRRINFSGNSKTADDVLRRAMRQNEAAIYGTSNIQRSERELRQLPFLEDISSKLEPVAGTDNQVDVNFNVKERSSSTISFGVGISDTDGFLINAGLNQANFMGTGRSVGFSFNNSAYETTYSINYLNPYYTEDGIARGFKVYYNQITPDDVNIANYDSTMMGAQVFYSIPLTDFNSLNLGYGLEHISLGTSGSTSDQVEDFVNENGESFLELNLIGGWSRNTYDRIIFPTEGTNQSLSLQMSLPATSDSLGYYKATYNVRTYVPIDSNRDYVLSLRGQAGYGGGFYGSNDLPFFENFYAGGINSVRGYTGNDLGPQSTIEGDSQDDEALGGNILLTGSVELIFPLPFKVDDLRTSLFVDAGNVFNTNVPDNEGGGFDVSDIVYSVGVGVSWRIPVVGAIQISLAKPLGNKADQSTQFFQFNVGSTF